MSIRFSIVTICFNAADILPVTLDSVLAQDFGDFEYVIQDGESSDNTPQLIESYIKRFAEKGVDVIYNREPDSGIYDAMNKAVSSARGEYVNFMNAGDCFYDDKVLRNVSSAIDRSGKDDPVPDIVYGECAVYEYGRFYRFPKSYENIEENMPFSHQTVFAGTGCLKDHPFNTLYRYSADYDFLLTMYDEKKVFLDCGMTVCITTADGTSSINYHDTLMESAAIRKAHGLFNHSEAELARTERSLRIKQFVLDHFPVFVRRFIRGQQIKKRGQNISVNIPKWFETWYN